VAEPLAVLVEVYDPQTPTAPPDPQVTVQVTPAFAESFATTAVTDDAPFSARDVGGAGVNVTVIGALAAVIVMLAEADFVASATDVAVTVTLAGLGTAEGAVYTVAVPLGVDVGAKDPQAPAEPQVTVQVTPLLAESLVTTAVKDCVALVVKEAGAAGLNATVIAGGGVVVL
jgi:hypothetical protein